MFAGVDERLLGLLGQRLPSTDSLLRGNVRANSVDIQIQRNTLH